MTNWCYKIVFCIFVCGLIAFIVINVRQQYVRMHEHHRLVRTTTGPIRGERLYTLFEMHAYYSFKGIPYAQPPIGELRFLPPLPVKPWYETLECHDHGQICLQHNTNGTEILGSEDCLYLNVYTPDCMPPVLKTVMIYLHGGAWYHGSGNTDLQGPDFLINQDVVVVTLNYRLGFMGFLSLGTPKYSGNQGLKDQQLAMQWINDNIHLFGGDKKKVTLFGTSAGSLSCQFHILAPSSANLFHRTIEMSFTSDIWAVFEPVDHNKEAMYRFATQQNKTVQSDVELLEFLQTINVSAIFSEFPFVRFKMLAMPTIEPATALQPIVQGTPEDIMYERNFMTSVDVMTGITTSEAIQFGSSALFKDFLKNVRIEIPSLHFDESQYNTSAYKRANERIQSFYFPNNITDNNETYQNYIRLKSDVYQRYRLDKKIKMLAKKSTGKTYYYRFGLETQLNLYKHSYENGHMAKGVSHGDDLCYVFRCMIAPELYSNLTVHSKEYEYIKLMTGLYANFAKTAEPLPNGHPHWKPVRVGEYNFLDITMHGLRTGKNPFESEINFWNSLMEEYPELA